MVVEEDFMDMADPEDVPHKVLLAVDYMDRAEEHIGGIRIFLQELPQ